MALLSADGLSIHAINDDGRDVQILRNVSLSLEKGERKALMGHSGSGKTTLANALMGFLKADTFCDRGTVSFEDITCTPQQITYEMIGNDPFQTIRGTKLAYVMQNVKGAFDPTVKMKRQIEELFAEDSYRIRKEKAEKLLEKAEIADVKKVFRSYPGTLSEGTLQKIMIMMALEREPMMIILDEPFSSLDQISKEHMISNLKNSSAGFLLITHDIQAAKELCTSCWFMDEGWISKETDLAPLSEEDIRRHMEL